MEKKEIRFLLHIIYFKKRNIYGASEGICKPDTESINHKEKRWINTTEHKFLFLKKINYYKVKTQAHLENTCNRNKHINKLPRKCKKSQRKTSNLKARKPNISKMAVFTSNTGKHKPMMRKFMFFKVTKKINGSV